MGAGIAQIAAQAGHPVMLLDSRDGAAAGAVASVRATLERLAEKGKMSAEAADAAAKRLQPVDALGDLGGSALVVEAIVEDLEAKRKLFAALEAIVGSHAILASNTSSFSITAIAARLRHPGRCIGMHFFNPAPIMPLVEVVSGLATDSVVAETIHATATAWGKSPVHARSTPGFIVNRIARPYYGEALRLASEHAAGPATIDAVMREAGGFRMGPFELMDLIGHDVNFAVTSSVWRACFHDSRYTPSFLQLELVEAGCLGRKSGRGFYDYASGAGTPAPATAATAVRPPSLAVAGDLGFASALAARIGAGGLTPVARPADPAIGEGYLLAGSAIVAATDGRTATRRAAEAGHANVVLFDLALDYGSATRVALARAEQCSEGAWSEAVGLFQAAGFQVSPLDDVPGLAVMRIVAMLANEAADAVLHGVASAHDVDLAMRKGVNYPRGPLAWAEAIGVPAVARVIAHLGEQYGEDRYRVSPLLARKAIARKAFHGA